MLYRLLFLCTIVSMLAFVGCSEDSNPTSPDIPDDNSGIPPLIENSYQPLSIGSYWKYTGGETYTQTVIGGTIIDGKYFFTTEYVVPGAALNSYQYMREENKTLYTFTPAFAPEVIPQLRYDLSAGASWMFTRTINSTKNYYTHTIMAKDTIRTVLGQIYNNVIHIRYSNFAIADDGDTLRFFDDHDIYFARGIGTIEYNKPLLGTTYLREHFIKK